MLEIVISIVATAIVSVLIARWQMKKNRIDHYIINSYDIGKGLTDVFPEFQLHYGNEILSKNVKVLQGGFMNTGRNDIGDNGKQEDIKIVLPEGCTVKAVKIVPLVSGLVVNRVDDKGDKKNVVIFRINDIFKTNECFEYSIITEVPEDMGSLEGKISFKHRIKNTKDIQTIYFGQYQNRMFEKIDKLVSGFGIVFFGTFLISILCIDRWRTMYFDVFQSTFQFHGAKWVGFIFLFPILLLVIFCAERLFGRRNRFIKAINSIHKNKE